MSNAACANCGDVAEGPVVVYDGLIYHWPCRPMSASHEPSMTELADLRRRVEALEKAFGVAMQDAMRVIETVGTTAAEDMDTFRRAEAWLKTYFPDRT